VLILMRLIDAQFNELPKQLSADLLAAVALVTDYYGCNSLVGYHMAFMA
jgi:hypothetical protein